MQARGYVSEATAGSWCVEVASTVPLVASQTLRLSFVDAEDGSPLRGARLLLRSPVGDPLEDLGVLTSDRLLVPADVPDALLEIAVAGRPTVLVPAARLPSKVALPRGVQPVHERVGFRAQSSLREGGRMQLNAAGTNEFHRGSKSDTPVRDARS